MLRADEDRKGGGFKDAAIAHVLGGGRATVERVRRRCVRDGLDAALERTDQANRRTKVRDGAGEATRVMLAGSDPPSGSAEWTLRLLGDKMVDGRLSTAYRRRPLGGRSNQPKKALAQEVLASSPEREGSFCWCHGGCLQRRPKGVGRCHGSGRCRRDLQATDQGDPDTLPHETGASRHL